MELRQQVDTREGDNLRLDERIGVVKLAVATKAEECEAKKAEIAAMEASRKVRAVLSGTMKIPGNYQGGLIKKNSTINNTRH